MKCAAVIVFFTLAAASTAQTPETAPPEPPHVFFRFERPGLPIPRFVIEIREDGTGRYEGDEAIPAGQDGTATTVRHFDRTIQLSGKTAGKIFAATHELKDFAAPCASAAKHIADTGRKTLEYRGSATQSCTYNYSEDKRVVLLTGMFQGIAETLDIGRKLDFDHRFDRLGLDADTRQLADEVESGRAMEPGTIAATLRSIAQDGEVMERVRARAGKLLNDAGLSQVTSH